MRYHAFKQYMNFICEMKNEMAILPAINKFFFLQDNFSKIFASI